MSRPLAFKQSDVTRALKGAKAGGFAIGAIRIEANGAILLLPPSGRAVPTGNTWDDVQ